MAYARILAAALMLGACSGGSGKTPSGDAATSPPPDALGPADGGFDTAADLDLRGPGDVGAEADLARTTALDVGTEGGAGSPDASGGSSPDAFDASPDALADASPDASADATPDASPDAKLTGLALDRAEVSFGIWPTGCAPIPSRSVRVTNQGPLAAEALTVSIRGNPGFSPGVDGCKGKSLAVGASCDIEVTFGTDTHLPGAYAAVLVIEAGPDSVQATLVGQIAVREAVFNASPVALSFADTMIGASRSSIVTLTAWPGAPTPQVPTFAVTSSQFLVGNHTCTAMRLPSTASCEVEVTFRPTSQGPQAGTLVVTSPTACGPNQVDVPLSGRGVP